MTAAKILRAVVLVEHVQYNFMKSVINLEAEVKDKEKLFLGTPLGVINTCNMKYPVFDRLYKEQRSFIWIPDEISMERDRSDAERLSKTERFIFENNLSFQTVGDSFLGSGIDDVLRYVTNSEFKLSLKTHGWFEECIHTPSYSHAIQNIYNDPAARFDMILKTQEVKNRAEKSVQKFNRLLNHEDSDPRVGIVNTLIGLLALEGISFYNSFSTSFFFAKNGKMTGTGSIIKLIRRDERLHKANIINALRILTSEPSEDFLDLKPYIEQTVLETFSGMAQQEFDWIKYLMSEGELPGLSELLLSKYVKYLTNKTLQELGIHKGVKIFEETPNPFPWIESFIGSTKSTQVAPQEMEITNYVKSAKNDLEEMEL
jgi:ribonucleoside-diphosphate reductase beta chain